MASNVHWVPSCNATLEVYILLAGSPRVAAGVMTAIYVTVTNNFYQGNIIEPKICTLGKYLSYMMRRSNPIEKETK